MIRLSEELAVSIEEAAAKSLELYPDWKEASEENLLASQTTDLEALNRISVFLPKEPITVTMASSELLALLVRLAVVRTLLGEHSQNEGLKLI